MPCTDGGVPYETEETVSLPEAVLCGLLNVLLQFGTYSEYVSRINWKECGVSCLQFDKWWFEHQNSDRERKEKERLRSAALAKLTAKEKEALGL